MNKSFERAIVIDGNALIYKAFFVFQNPSKENLNEVESINHMQRTINLIENQCKKLLEKGDYKYAVVVFDSSKKTFRQEIFSDYKSNREAMPDILFKSLNLIQLTLSEVGFAIVKAPESYEGDDLIATLAEKFSNKNIKTDVFSTDKDLLQLVNYWTSVHLLKKGITQVDHYDYENFYKQFNDLVPAQIPAWKALAGDVSDNYKGLPGIGEVKAAELIRKYKTIDNIYKNIHELPEKLQKVFLENKDQLSKFLEIATVVRNLEISADLKNYLKNKKDNF